MIGGAASSVRKHRSTTRRSASEPAALRCPQLVPPLPPAQRVTRWGGAAQELHFVGREAIEVQDQVLQLDLQLAALGEHRAQRRELTRMLLGEQPFRGRSHGTLSVRPCSRDATMRST